MEKIYATIQNLVSYAIREKLAEEEDRSYLINRLLEILHLDTYEEPKSAKVESLETLLSSLCDYAYRAGLIAENSVVYRDLFDTKIMGALTPRPGEVCQRFQQLYQESPEKATDYFYHLAKASDYIRTYRVKKDLKWSVLSPYGEIDISINLSKPEKDPKAIAAAKLLPQSGYPKCLLCHENEGYAGRLNAPARQTLRQIPIMMNGTKWYLQYSPYVYYNEHCIALNAEHTPMKIDRSSFCKLLDFITVFPHYFLGSNADLPIVGGSILSHDHMQGGRYTFAMEKAGVEIPLSFSGFEDVEAGIVYWPMSVIRIASRDKERLVDLADKILRKWRSYTDAESLIYAETDGVPHNTITPIARSRNGKFELDLVLRNNITTEEHPLGLYHPHAQYHNIKKENIGLIEVMGLAILPARLKAEMEELADMIVSGGSFADHPDLQKHENWFSAFKDNYDFTAENIIPILQNEIGKTFTHVLEDAGVYKCTDTGRQAFLRFITFVNAD